ncbi:MAG TPA: methyltransferase [Ilumatobacteraceae bacterium]|nr:methyltransferase [Ilumatobacteraceae bacterium]
MDQRTVLIEAMSLLRDGRLDGAESILGEVLSVQPGQPDALHLLGLCHHERTDPESAERLIREAIRCWPDGDPQVCVAWNNLGNVLVESAQPEAAVEAYRVALSAHREASGTWNNLAGLLRRLGRLDEAEQAARQAVAAAADDPHAWFTLARVLIEVGDVHGGLQAHARGVALAPRDVVGREEVLRSLAVLGHRDEAAVLWGEWLQESPDDPIAFHHHAACVGRPPPFAADAYVESVFDSFASSFDAKLAKLEYRAPELIVGALTQRLGADTGWGTVADLGCGTGLVGMLLRQRTLRLVGVDLSHTMLERARRRGIYDELTQTNLVSFLHGEAASLDVVVAADVLCYFGVLDEVIAAAARALRPGGVIVFTVESLPEVSDDWLLSLTGRYAHSPRYLATAMAGFDDVAIDPCELRMEAGLPVPGLLVSAHAR